MVIYDFYTFLIALFKIVHVVSAIVWLGAFPALFVLKNQIMRYRGTKGERKLISSWLIVNNLTGMIGAIGIVVTGIVLTLHYSYGFFQFASGTQNHWLYTKQFLTVIVLIITGVWIIPTGVKVRKALHGEINKLEDNEPLTDHTYTMINKLTTLTYVIAVIVLLNFLFAITRTFQFS